MATTETGLLPSEATEARPGASGRDLTMLFLASFLALYFELVVIRYLSTEIRVFAYFKNLPLISSFLGLGLGMARGRPPRVLKQLFPLIAAVLFLLIAFASPLHLTHVPAPGEDYFLFGQDQTVVTHLVSVMRYTFVMLSITALVISFFVMLGGIVGEKFSKMQSLRGYTVNLAGSLAGIMIFALLSFWRSPPGVWMLLGLILALPFIYREPWAVLTFAFVVMAITVTHGGTYWSPYYRITLQPFPYPVGSPHPAVYLLTANHDGHQTIFDHSSDALKGYPPTEFNRAALKAYDLPYQMIPRPDQVLVVGAGTGNDVASALRHGAAHVDAVEIDPVIVDLGRRFHHEKPYDSARVSVHVDDARAFFHKTNKKYDLIVFGFLDSLTLLSSYSSVRLDNYVYTVESFREAKGLLQSGGTLVLTFASHRAFLTERLYATLGQAFGVAPRAYQLDAYDMAFIEGHGRNATAVGEFQDVSEKLHQQENATRVATDRWPFLYLARPTIPKSIIWVLVPFLAGAAILLHKTIGLRSLGSRQAVHFCLLGAGFLLLETKAVTELSLLFGSTWIVNVVVIAAFLLMAVLANTYVMLWPVSRKAAYAILFVVLTVGMMFPYARLDALPDAGRVLAAAVLVGLPIFFTGLIFSRSFRDVGKPAEALGVNLLGAVIGGALENTVMLAGTVVLGILAIFLYSLSAVCLKDH